MLGLAGLAAVSADAAKRKAQDAVASAAIKVALYGAAGLLGGGALVFASVAMFFALREPFGPAWAALASAGALLLLALVLALLAPRLSRPKATPSPIPATALMAQAASGDLRKAAPYVAAAAFAAGFISTLRR